MVMFLKKQFHLRVHIDSFNQLFHAVLRCNSYMNTHTQHSFIPLTSHNLIFDFQHAIGKSVIQPVLPSRVLFISM